jgi:hypothetical protein
MNTPPATHEYLLLLRGTQLENRLSLDEMQTAIGKFSSWLDRLTRAGQLKIGQPLGNEGRVISGANERTVADGPFAEAKEAVGGYLLLTVADFDTAVAIAKECPLLDYDAQVEVRPILQQCAAMQLVQEGAAVANA